MEKVRDSSTGIQSKFTVLSYESAVVEEGLNLGTNDLDLEDPGSGSSLATSSHPPNIYHPYERNREGLGPLFYFFVAGCLIQIQCKIHQALQLALPPSS